MGFKLLVLIPTEQDGMEYIINTWPDNLKETIPGIEVNLARSAGEAMEVIGEVDAAFGNIVPELFERANNLKWIACPQAGGRPDEVTDIFVQPALVLLYRTASR